MKRIADTGLIVAMLTRNDPHHLWAAAAFRENAPFHTCEAVIVEACSFFPDPRPVLTLVARGDLVVEFSIAAEIARLLALTSKYADQPMDIADACIVRMTELANRCKVWTVDRGDFQKYRKHGRDLVPCEFPPNV